MNTQDMCKDLIEGLIKSFKNNNPISIQEWAMICASHIFLYPEKYNINGSCKSVCELEGKEDENMYGSKGVIH